MLSRTYDTEFTTNFEYFMPKSDNKQKFTILYTHGFCSDPWGRKPEEIKKWCLKNNIAMYRYELAGHGSDAARFEQTDINIWKAQILEIIDKYIEGDIVLVGSSLGGWLSMIAAINRPNRIKGLVGLAAAPDFTVDNIKCANHWRQPVESEFQADFQSDWQAQLGGNGDTSGVSRMVLHHMKYATPAQIEEMEKYGKITYPGQNITFTVTKRLIDSGNENLILDKESIDIFCPVVLIQGMQDTSVDWHKALKIAERVKTNDVIVKLLKNTGHRLNDDFAINEILSALDTFL